MANFRVANGHAADPRVANGNTANGNTADPRVANGHLANEHVANGHVANGHVANGHAASGHAANGHAANRHTADPRVADGHATDTHLANGHVMNGQRANGHVANGHAANGHAANTHVVNQYAAIGHVTSGHIANGHAANGHAADPRVANGNTVNGHTADPRVANAPATNGPVANGHAPNGHAPNGHADASGVANGHAPNGPATNGHAPNGHAADAQQQRRQEAAARSRSSARQLLTLLRPRQWVKNGFVAAPLFLTPWALGWETLGATAVGIAAFCAVASAIYILNDYMDREADGKHPVKRYRPLAAGTVSVAGAFSAFVLLLAGGVALGLALSVPFMLLLVAYFALNATYSLGLKNVAIADVLSIALGFVLRVEAGALLIATPTTEWITIMTGLLALFIALAKRRDDLIKSISTSHRSSLAGYNKAFLDNATTAILGALLVTYLIYTTDARVMQQLDGQQLFYTTPFVAAGIMRYLQLMFVEARTGDPTELVWTDRFLQGSIAGWALCYGLLLY